MTIYVFHPRRADRVKLVFSGGTGVSLPSVSKTGTSAAVIADGVIRVTAAQLAALLEGLDRRQVHESRETTAPGADVI